jgi:predicted esterase
MSTGSSTGSVGGGDGIVVPAPSGSATSSVVFLHGLGDTADGWTSAFPLPGLENTKYILPTAPMQPVTLNGRMPMNSWFDVFGLDESAADDAPGIAKAAARVARIVDDEIAAGIPADKIVVAGFSQGGAVALAAAFSYERRLAGVLGMSTWLPKCVRTGEMSASMLESKVLMCHGEADTTVPLKWGKLSVAALKQLSVNCDIKTYPGMAHSASQEELADVRRFIKTCLA